MLGCEPSTAAALHIRGQLTHRLLRDLDSFAPTNRGLRRIDSGKNFRPAPLAFDPKAHCLLYDILSALKPPAVYGAADEVLLLGCQDYLHGSNLSIAGSRIKKAT
jgi:hypothetical protein